MDTSATEEMFLSTEAIAIATTSGATSLVFSMLMLSIIMRSKERLSSPYHKITSFMSFWDIITSACILLTIVPMPSDVRDTYPFAEGRSYGNTLSCEIQGFLIITGQTFAMSSNIILNIFYLCTLRYGKSPEYINKRVLPIAFTVSALVSLTTGILPLAFGFLNPQQYEVFCYVGPYPKSCNKDESIECIRGEMKYETENLIFFIFGVVVGTVFLLFSISLLLVVFSVFKTEMTVRRLQIEAEQDAARFRGDSDEKLSLSRTKELRYTRTAGRMALMYISAFLITWIWTVISVVPVPKTLGVVGWLIIGYGRLLIFVPLQGFFNCLIFVYNKVHNILSSSPDEMTFSQALKKVIFSPSIEEEQVIVSTLGMVKRDIAYREEVEKKWKSFASNETPNKDLKDVLSATGLAEDALRTTDEKVFEDSPPKRQFYSNVNPLFHNNQVREIDSNDNINSSPSIQSSDLVSIPSSTIVSSRQDSLLSGFSSALSAFSHMNNDASKVSGNENKISGNSLPEA
jgi:hypothetical protein